ncbi:uncharacterized protein RJT21DRAFT_111724 [Scheffersomyces amazonensis]|uniref:uncharacterized protein n=1 Tax=Scheffersomyces amazonensis TaxID=1078765 RepID=UPI00315D381A
MAFLSGGDVTLKKKIKIKSFPRKQRRLLIEALDKVIKSDDIKFYPELWKLAFHSLHVGEFKHTRIPEIAQRYRNENNVHTLDTNYCEAIKEGKSKEAVDTLKIKPSVFARNLDKLIRDCFSTKRNEDINEILDQFEKCISKIGSKVLLQLLSHFQRRKYFLSELSTEEGKKYKRLVQISGSISRTYPIPNNDVMIPNVVLDKVIDILNHGLIEKFGTRGLLKDKRAYLAPGMEDILIPLQLSSASAKKTLARGSKIPIFDIFEEDKDKKNILRFFLHWIGYIIDLSMMLIDSDLENPKYVFWKNLKVADYALHSGDILLARPPKGASQFIDVDMKKAIDAGNRYVILDARVWGGGPLTFAKHELCFGGVMAREEMNSGEIYEPSTVKYKFDLQSETRNTIMFLFDLELKELIWVDTSMNVGPCSDIQGDSSKVCDVIREVLKAHKHKVSIAQLVDLHVKANDAEIVDDKSKANFIVSMTDDGDLDVYNVAEINSNWI